MAAVRGDALKLEDGAEVRLAGIEAPAQDAPWGEAARAALQRLAAGRRVDLLLEGAGKDAAGARVAQVRVVDGPWLEAALLEVGVVRVRPRPGEAALTPDLYAHEARARAHRRGLWGDAASRVRLPDEFGWEDHGLQVMEGRVRRVSSGRGRLVYLDFADDWRGVVSAEIPTRQLRDWRAAALTAGAAGQAGPGEGRGARTASYGRSAGGGGSPARQVIFDPLIPAKAGTQGSGAHAKPASRVEP